MIDIISSRDTHGAGAELDFIKEIRRLGFKNFMLAFGVIWDAKLNRYTRLDFWAGVRGHPGQFEMLEALDTSPITWFAKSRQKAGTTLWAASAAYTMMTEENALGLIFSLDAPSAKATLDERVARTLRGWEQLTMPDGKTPWPWPKWRIMDDYIEFPGRSIIEPKSSERGGAISRTPRKILFDEAKTYRRRDAEEMWASFIPTLKPPAQVAVISTAGGEWFDNNTRELEKKPIPKMSFLFIPDDIDPTHTPEWRADQIKIFFGDEVRLKREHPLEFVDMFQSHVGLVLGSLTEDHFKTPEHLRDGLRWHHEDRLMLFYDHGHTKDHPAACWFIHYRPSLDHAHVFDEVFLRGKELPETAADIKGVLQSAWDGDGRLGTSAPYPSECRGDIYGREGSRSVGDVLSEETGLQWEGVYKPDKEGSLELFKARVYHGRWSMDGTRCWQSKKQLLNWRWIDGRDKASDTEDEAGDLGRYLSHHLNAEDKPTAKTYMEVLMAKAAARSGVATGKDVGELGGGMALIPQSSAPTINGRESVDFALEGWRFN